MWIGIVCFCFTINHKFTKYSVHNLGNYLSASQRFNDSAFLDSWLNSDSDKVFAFNLNSILQDAYCIKTQFKIQFNHQHFISIQFTIQLGSLNVISNQFTIPLNGWHGVFWRISPLGPLPILVWYTILCIQLEIEPQLQCCQVWLVPTGRMQMCSKRQKYIVKIEL